MSTVTRWALKHKLVVVAFWLVLTVAGAYASLGVEQVAIHRLVPGVIEGSVGRREDVQRPLAADVPAGGAVVLGRVGDLAQREMDQ